MQQRNVTASRRPSGTDGSDFSYRMVVDSRYTKVAKGISRLGALLILQGVNQIVWTFMMLLAASQEKKLETFVVVSLSVGFISIVIGEIGRRKSNTNLLRFYIIISSIATVLSVACITESDLYMKVMQQKSLSGATCYELAEIDRATIGVALQIIVTTTTVKLVHNMSPKRAS